MRYFKKLGNVFQLIMSILIKDGITDIFNVKVSMAIYDVFGEKSYAIESQFLNNCHCTQNIIFLSLENVKIYTRKISFPKKFNKLLSFEENGC